MAFVVDPTLHAAKLTTCVPRKSPSGGRVAAVAAGAVKSATQDGLRHGYGTTVGIVWRRNCLRQRNGVLTTPHTAKVLPRRR